MEETELENTLSAALLAAAQDGVDTWATLQDARSRLSMAVDAANAALAANPLTSLVAQQVADVGGATVRVDGSGTVLLCNPPTAGGSRKYHSYLPSIAALRRNALALGLDPTKYGRRKRDLNDAIEAAKAGVVRGKRIVTAPAIGPVTVLGTGGPAN